MELTGAFSFGNSQQLTELIAKDLGRPPKICYFGDDIFGTFPFLKVQRSNLAVGDVWAPNLCGWTTVGIVEELERRDTEQGLPRSVTLMLFLLTI